MTMKSRDIYLHPGRKDTTYRVWRLLDSQLDSISQFLLTEQPTWPSPFPMFATNANLYRHDPWDAIARHHIYRDPWERKIPLLKPASNRDVRSTGDHPELELMFDKLNEAHQAYLQSPSTRAAIEPPSDSEPVQVVARDWSPDTRNDHVNGGPPEDEETGSEFSYGSLVVHSLPQSPASGNNTDDDLSDVDKEFGIESPTAGSIHEDSLQ